MNQHDVAATAASLHDVCHNVMLHVRALSCSWHVTPRQSHDANVSNQAVQSGLQFQSSKSRRGEAVNRGTCVPFLLKPSQPVHAAFLLLIIEDCLFHPWGSVVLLDFHFGLPFIQCSNCPSNVSKNIVPPHQHWSTTHVPCESARAASDAAVPSRSERAENDRVGDIGMEGGGWLLPPWQQCVFVSARESVRQVVTHSQEETHTVTFILILLLAQRKPNKDSYTNMHGDGGKRSTLSQLDMWSVNPEK